MPPPPVITLPETIPVMVLSQCTLFPHSLLPLYIFEPRYREMLAYALDHERMFAVGYLEAGSSWSAEDETDVRIRSITTCGVVRACVGRPDGTSHLMLQGLQRVSLDEWVQREPFRIARITRIEATPAEAMNPESAALAAHLIQLVREQLPAPSSQSDPLLIQLSQVQDLGMLVDIVAANFLVDGQSRQHLLEILDPQERWQALVGKLGLTPS